ncbi:MAG: DNA repair protein RecN [Lachnospiraceae bacterium]|nr:DNA repair protein RecN [Lachnospiraceae bacterium]
MLQSIHVKNIALIDEVEIELDQGLHILSGETGAGKSIIIDAVNFTLGKRMPKDVVREDADYALCELVFTVENEKQEEVLKDLDLPAEDGLVIMQRKITNGRSISRVNGENVSTAALKELAGVLIDIHGQHEHQSLLYEKKHREILDQYCGPECEALKGELKEAYARYTALSSELEEAKEHAASRERDLELAMFEAEEIEQAKIVPGEDEQLEADYNKMVHAKRILEAVTNAHRNTGYDMSDSAGNAIGRSVSELRSVSDLDPELNDLLETLTQIDDLLNDFNRSVADYEKSLYFEDDTFAQTEERLNLLNKLKSKYGGSLQSVSENLDALKEKIEKLSDYEAYLTDLSRRHQAEKETCLALCEKISKLRSREAGALAEELCASLKDLNFLDARFEIRVSPDPDAITPEGYDQVSFLISTNPGEKVKPLVNVASGGELSRIMLALKAVLSRKDEVTTLIFDEIDTGISGVTAAKVSEKLSDLAKIHQVICVTHLPQIASMADVHYEISKSVNDGRTVTEVKRLEGNERERELARMLSGAQLTDAVMQNAREMIKRADGYKKNDKIM